VDKRYPYMIFVLLGLLGIFYKCKQVLYTMHEYKCFNENILAGVVGTSLLPETKGIPLNQGKANTITYSRNLVTILIRISDNGYLPAVFIFNGMDSKAVIYIIMLRKVTNTDPECGSNGSVFFFLLNCCNQIQSRLKL
jgi:hypothetical protein